MKEIVAAHVRKLGMVTSASERAHSFRAKPYMAEDSLGLVLLQRGSYFDNRISIS